MIVNLITKRNKNAADELSAAADAAASTGAAIERDYPTAYFASLSLVPASRTSTLRRRKATRALVTVGAIAGLVTVGILGVAVAGLLLLKGQEDQARSERDTTAEAVAGMQPVNELFEGFEERQTAVANALASDVDYYALISEVQDAIQAEIPREALAQDASGQVFVKSEYAHIGLTTYTVSAAPCPTEEVFQPEPALGCIQARGVSSSYAAAGEAMALMNDGDNGLFGGYILSASDEQTSSTGVGTTSWSFSINFGAQALSGKYDSESSALLGSDSATQEASDGAAQEGGN